MKMLLDFLRFTLDPRAGADSTQEEEDQQLSPPEEPRIVARSRQSSPRGASQHRTTQAAHVAEPNSEIESRVEAFSRPLLDFSIDPTWFSVLLLLFVAIVILQRYPRVRRSEDRSPPDTPRAPPAALVPGKTEQPTPIRTALLDSSSDNELEKDPHDPGEGPMEVQVTGSPLVNSSSPFTEPEQTPLIPLSSAETYSTPSKSSLKKGQTAAEAPMVRPKPAFAVPTTNSGTQCDPAPTTPKLTRQVRMANSGTQASLSATSCEPTDVRHFALWLSNAGNLVDVHRLQAQCHYLESMAALCTSSASVSQPPLVIPPSAGPDCVPPGLDTSEATLVPVGDRIDSVVGHHQPRHQQAVEHHHLHDFKDSSRSVSPRPVSTVNSSNGRVQSSSRVTSASPSPIPPEDPQLRGKIMPPIETTAPHVENPQSLLPPPATEESAREGQVSLGQSGSTTDAESTGSTVDTIVAPRHGRKDSPSPTMGNEETSLPAEEEAQQQAQVASPSSIHKKRAGPTLQLPFLGAGLDINTNSVVNTFTAVGAVPGPVVRNGKTLQLGDVMLAVNAVPLPKPLGGAGGNIAKHEVWSEHVFRRQEESQRRAKAESVATDTSARSVRSTGSSSLSGTLLVVNIDRPDQGRMALIL